MFCKKLRKSFTLVELSIVLLILSMLLGTLLVGRKIVDRAKMQRIIFEIDYYKKSLSLFRDTFDVLPGNMDKETCMKYSEFSSINVTDGEDVGAFCDTDRATSGGKSRMTDGYVNSSVIGTSDKWSIFLETMRQMKTSKIINEVGSSVEDAETVATVAATTLNSGPNKIDCKECISYENVKRTQGLTSFDSSGAVSIAGVRVDSSTYARRLNFIRGSNNYDGKSGELDDANYARTMNGNNVIFFYRNTPADADELYGNGSRATGIVSADILNKIDIKIDDGRPGSGNVLALKNGYVKSEGLSTDDQKRICYNDMQNNVSNAYYTSETEDEYGCNFGVIVR